MADVNGDGKPDLIVANQSTVSVLLGNGNGTFQSQSTFATGNGSMSLAVGDVNGDGNPDLVVTNGNGGGNTVSVLLGNGNGTFQNHTTFATAGRPDFVTMADVNGDGKPDLIVACASYDNLSVLLNLASGSFTGQVYQVVSPANHFAVSAPSSITAGNALVFTVTALNQLNTTDPTYSGTVHFSTTDARITPPSDATLTNGVGTFTVILKTAGSQTLTATDTTTSSISGTSTAITVKPAAATHFGTSAPANTTAGNPFVFVVTALDSFNNIATAFADTIALTSSDSHAGLPANPSLTAGVGFFAAVLKTAGNQVLTVTDTTTNAIAPTSQTIAVSAAAATHFSIVAPSGAVLGIAFPLTVNAVDPFDNTSPTYAGTVHFTSSDSAAALPPDSTLSGGSGVFSATLATSGNQTITAMDTASGIKGVSAAIAVRGLVVTGLSPTPTGFAVTFDKPVDPTTLHLYYAPDDVLLVDGSGRAIRGSLALNTAAGSPPDTSFTFVATSGVLAAGTYTVTLVSGASGIKDQSGVQLDGTNSGMPGNNYVATFTVAATPSVVLSIPDFARGPDGAANILLPNNTGSGIPITLSGAANLTDITFNLTFNPALLNISGTLNGPSGTFTLQSNAGGVANFAFQSSTPFSGTITLGYLLAQVPNSAASSYKTKALLHLGNIVVINGGSNGGSTAADSDDIEAVAYLADVAGTGSFSPLDAALISQVAVGIETGFSAFEQLDPAIIGNVTSTGNLNSSDVTLMNRLLAGIATPQIPQPPSGLAIPATGPDPTLSVPTVLTPTAGGTVTVPVDIDTARPAGSSGLTEATLALHYDPQVYSVTAADIKLGTVPSAATGWQLDVAINPETGEIGITLFSTTPIQSTAGGSLVTITLQTVGSGIVGSVQWAAMLGRRLAS